MVATAVLFAVLFVGLLTRAVDLAVLRGPDFARRAAIQHRTRVALTPRRGDIVDRNGDKLALSLDVPSVYVRPKAFAGHEADLPAVAKALGLSLKAVQAKVTSRQPFVWLRRRATPRQAEAVERMNLPGVGTLDEARRFYPHGSLAAHVLGIVGVDSRGLEGIEHRFDEVIRGEPEWLDVDRDAHGREILRGGGGSGPPQGSRLELTLDVGCRRSPSASSPPGSPRRAQQAAARSSSTRGRARSWRWPTCRRSIPTTPETWATPGSAPASAIAPSPIRTSPARRSRRCSPPPRSTSTWCGRTRCSSARTATTRSASGRSTTPIRTAGSRSRK